MEELQVSLKYLFFTQRITLLSVLGTSDTKPSSKVIARLLVFLLSYCTLVVRILVFTESPDYISSEGQSVSLTNDTKNVPANLSTVLLMLTWISAVIFRSKESQFYYDLVDIDRLLTRFGPLKTMYQKYSKASRILLLPIVLHLTFFIAIVCVDIRKMTHMLFPIILFAVTSIGNFTTSYCFYFNIKLMRDRFELVNHLTRHCFTMKELEELERVHKSLITLMDTINNSMGIKVGFVLLSNFLNAVSFSYTVFVGFIVPYQNPLFVYYNIVAVILPHVMMLFMTFLSGEWITTAVSVL